MSTQTTEWAGPASCYHLCTPGNGRHWGVNGAAGILPVAKVDGEAYVLLSHRSPHVDHGDTWSTIGGAVDATEAPEDAARRELTEEVTGITPGQRIAEIEAPCSRGCGWAYRTYIVAAEYGDVSPAKGASSWETAGVAWVPASKVEASKLHPGFAASWPTLRTRIA